MNKPVPESLGIIAGKGAYPWLLADSAKKQGVKRLFVVAFKKETDPVIERYVDDIRWIHIGQLGPFIDAFRQSGVKQAVMAGQITPTHLFRLRPDKPMFQLLSQLKEKNAETIFGAIGNELRNIGVELMPASLFMEYAMPEPGVLSSRSPTADEQRDIELGFKVAKVTSGLDIGQTVVIKNGTILAVEAFEGTDATILRAGDLSGPGAVIVKVAKQGHDMRFDIPVIGLHTMETLKKTKAAVLAVESGRTILLEREKLIAKADKLGLSLVAVKRES